MDIDTHIKLFADAYRAKLPAYKNYSDDDIINRCAPDQFAGWILAHAALAAPQQEPVAPYAYEIKDDDKSAGPGAMKLCYAAWVDRYQRAKPESIVRWLYDAPPTHATSFQDRVQPWMMACFGAEISADHEERNHRFLEEALELVQACGATASEAHQLVDYVYGRPVGEKRQEVGGVMVTLAALCLANDMDMHAAGETELARIWTKVEQIRAKQAAKPKHSPLPEMPASHALSDEEKEEVRIAIGNLENYGASHNAAAMRALLAKVRP